MARGLAEWCDTHTLYEFMKLMDEYEQDQKEKNMNEIKEITLAGGVRGQAVVGEYDTTNLPVVENVALAPDVDADTTFVQTAEDIGLDIPVEA